MMRTGGDAAVGMMDAAYFTGRKELLDFFNDLLDLNLTKIEQTASGAVACQLTDYIFPGSIRMDRINWEAKSDYEFVQNYKLLQAAFNKHHVKRHVDVDRLIRAKYQDNLEFCQWLKAFFDQHSVFRADYDPVAARAKGKGAAKVNQFLDQTAGKYNSKTVPSTQPTRARRTVAAGGGAPRTTAAATRRPVTSTTARATAATTSKPAITTARVGRTTTTQKENTTSNSHTTSKDLVTDAILADANLMKKNSELNTKVAQLETAIVDIEKERDFYFDKMRDVECMLQIYNESSSNADDEESESARRLVENVFKVLYAKPEDVYTVGEDGEFVTTTVDNDDKTLDELLTDEA